MPRTTERTRNAKLLSRVDYLLESLTETSGSITPDSDPLLYLACHVIYHDLMDGQYYISEEAFEQATHAVMLRHRFTHDEALREAASHARTLSKTLTIIDGTDQ